MGGRLRLFVILVMKGWFVIFQLIDQANEMWGMSYRDDVMVTNTPSMWPR